MQTVQTRSVSSTQTATRKWILSFFIISLLVLLVVLFKVFLLQFFLSNNPEKSISDSATIIKEGEFFELTLAELQTYDGSDPEKPLLVAIDGILYDVSEGSRFYAKGEVYNFLIARDATTELQLVGTDLITDKYPVVGHVIK